MKTWIPIIIVFILFPSGFAQDIQHQASAINVEVPVRVFQGDTFIDILKLQDFEIYEDGRLQKIEAVYLVNGKDVLRKEELKDFSPDTSRSYYLLFEISDFIPRIREAIEYFVNNVLLPGDQVTLITPVKTYRMREETLRAIPREELIRQFVSVLKKDALIGGSAYRRAIEDLKLAAMSLVHVMAYPSEEAKMLTTMGQPDPGGAGPEPALAAYGQMLKKIDNLRRIDQEKLLEMAEHLRGTRGQKNVFLFYQREYLPQIDTKLLEGYRHHHQDDFVRYQISKLFDFYHRDVSFDVDRVERAFSDSSITINFMFYSMSPDTIPGIRMVEYSGDIFSAFNEMASATGGTAVSSANPSFLFRKAVEAAENYYLLYYAPENYMPDKKFHNIEVRIKNRGFRVSHRAGYFAD